MIRNLSLFAVVVFIGSVTSTYADSVVRKEGTLKCTIENQLLRGAPITTHSKDKLDFSNPSLVVRFGYQTLGNGDLVLTDPVGINVFRNSNNGKLSLQIAIKSPSEDLIRTPFQKVGTGACRTLVARTPEAAVCLSAELDLIQNGDFWPKVTCHLSH